MLAQQTRRVRGDTQRVWIDHDGHDQDRLSGLRREGRPFDDLEQSFFEADVADDDGDRALPGARPGSLVRGTDVEDDDDARAFTARKRAVRMRLGGLVAAGLAAGALVGFGVPRLAARIHGAQGPLPAASIPSAAAPIAAVPAKQTSAPAPAAAAVARPTPPATAGAIITTTEVTVPEVPDPEPIGGASVPRAPAAAADPEPPEAAPLKDVVWSDREQALVPAASATAAPEAAAPPAPPAPAGANELEATARP